jgi:hypothetical protein
VILDASGKPVHVEPIPDELTRDPFEERWVGMMESGYLLRRAEANSRVGLPLGHWVRLEW